MSFEQWFMNQSEAVRRQINRAVNQEWLKGGRQQMRSSIQRRHIEAAMKNRSRNS